MHFRVWWIEMRGPGLAPPPHPPPALRQLIIGADHLAMLAIGVALPDVERRPPVAVARQRPIHVVLEPFAETPGAGLRWMPIDLRVDFEHPRFHRRRPDEPGAAGVVDQRRVAAPAVGIAVRIRPGFEPAPLLLQSLDDQAIGFLVGDELALDLRPRRPLERAIRDDGVYECETVLLAGQIVIGAKRRSHVHEAGALVGTDEPAGYHNREIGRASCRERV